MTETYCVIKPCAIIKVTSLLIVMRCVSFVKKYVNNRILYVVERRRDRAVCRVSRTVTDRPLRGELV